MNADRVDVDSRAGVLIELPRKAPVLFVYAHLCIKM
jgi:hypothetical protein